MILIIIINGMGISPNDHLVVFRCHGSGSGWATYLVLFLRYTRFVLYCINLPLDSLYRITFGAPPIRLHFHTFTFRFVISNIYGNQSISIINNSLDYTDSFTFGTQIHTTCGVHN